MRALTAVFLAAAGLALGYAIGMHTGVIAAATHTGAAPEAARGRSAGPAAVNVPREASPSSEAAPLAAWSSAQEQLRQRALHGDGIAAAQWMETEYACSLGPRISPEYLLRAWTLGGMPYLPHVSDEEAARLADHAAISPEQREKIADAIADRLVAQCDGYRPADAAEFYALARLAAVEGNERAFWWFVFGVGAIDQRADVLSGGSSVQIARLRDWTQRVPALLARRGQQGDARAVVLLGVAYLTDDNDVEYPGLITGSFTNSVVGNDAEQAYRWLSLSLRAPDGTRPPAAQIPQWLDELGTQLDARQRDEAQRWAEAQPTPR